MKKKILGVLVGVFVVVVLATPMVGTVMAIGPMKAAEVGNNPKLVGTPMWAMLDDVGPNNIMWVNTLGVILSLPDARKGGGRINNAINADHDTVVDMQTNPQLYENKWVYLSGLGEPQWGGHGMFYWAVLPFFGPGFAGLLELEYADGVFYKTNKVGN